MKNQLESLDSPLFTPVEEEQSMKLIGGEDGWTAKATGTYKDGSFDADAEVDYVQLQ